MRAAIAAIGIAASAPAWADDSKLAKDDVAIQERGAMRGKNKLCCGYPLVDNLDWKLTYYWLAQEEKFDEREEIPKSDHLEAMDLYTEDYIYITTISEKLAWHLRMEGSGVLNDGRVLNYDGKCKRGYGTCFEVMDPETHPYGRGNKRRPLIPYKSVAVDPRFVPMGEPLYIPEFDGVLLPDGSTHDGCVRADDTGGGIREQHIDFFVVTHANYKYVMDQVWGVDWITPHIEEPRCDYLRDP
jgi:3D (Asp-Asp-Asp) domain-containing protein